MSNAELKQLALVGINSVMQTDRALPVNNSNTECARRYNNISKCCTDVNSNIRTTIANIALSNYNEIKIVLDK